jgi:hypothetical protein
MFSSIERYLLAGVHHRKMRFVHALSYVWGTAWFIVEPAGSYIAWVKATLDQFGSEIMFATLIVGIVCGLASMFVPARSTFSIRTTDTKILIKFGDLFSAGPNIVIPANNFFDSQIGAPVAVSSLHGALIQNVFGGDQQRFERTVDYALRNEASFQVARPIGRVRSYRTGTTAVLKEGTKTYLLVAFAHSDPVTCKAKANVEDLWRALTGLWQIARDCANGEPVAIPLMGSGLSGVGLEPIHLLRLIILSIVTETRKAKITSEVHIILPERLLSTLDLRSIDEDWG